MKQIQFQSFGQPSVVAQVMEIPDIAEPAAWEVAVQVEAFPINVADLAMLSGRYGVLPKLPSAIGMEAVGRVIAAGSAVNNLQVGDRVVLLSNNNWAEQRLVPAATVHKISSDIDLLQASMLKVNPTTAMLLLSRFAELEPGDWILQTAPLGSVGHCVMQLANSMGLRTINVVRRPEAIAEVHRAGGQLAIEVGDDLPSKVNHAIGHDRLMLCLDAVAGADTQLLASSLSEDAQIINYGMLSAAPCVMPPEHTIFRNINLRGFWLSKVLNRLNQAERTQLYDQVASNFLDGTFQIPVDSTFPLEAVNDALRRAEQGGRAGKIIVVV